MLVIHWFRRDLRLRDNLALYAAAQSGAPVIPLFILDPALIHSPYAGAPRLRFLLRALASLDAGLRQRGSRLFIRHGSPPEILPQMVEESGAAALYFNRDYSPYARKRDQALAARLAIPVYSCDDALLIPPGEVMKPDRTPFVVFTPFKKRWLALPKDESVPPPAPDAFIRVEAGLSSDAIPTLADLGFPPTIEVPEASEAEAARRLDQFIAERAYAYATRRNDLAADPADDTVPGTSFLSPYLRFGMLSPRQVYWAAREAYQHGQRETERESIEAWVNELVWREFYMHILYHFPHVLKRDFRDSYEHVVWRDAPDDVAAWQAGQTGYPVVDAALRQLRATGWIPNRARMIAASFLCKDLLIHWQEGERHFMNWLIDGDPAANNGGWQWSAGTGTDAQPYFRIFNPVAQSQKFDPTGRYIRRWIPELRGVPDAFIHAPWQMPLPPPGYPLPIVDHAFARARALDAFKGIPTQA